MLLGVRLGPHTLLENFKLFCITTLRSFTRSTHTGPDLKETCCTTLSVVTQLLGTSPVESIALNKVPRLPIQHMEIVKFRHL